VNNARRLIAWSVSLAVAALVWALPSLLSLPSVAPIVLAQISQRLPGPLSAQSVSVGWRQGVRCRNLRYHDLTLGLQLDAPTLASDKGLFALLLAPSYLGEITLDQPTLVVLPAPAEKKQDAAVADRPAVPWWETVTFRLKVNQGRVIDQSAPSGRELGRNLDLSCSLAMGTVNYALAFRSGQGAGHLRAQGFVNLPLAGQPLLASLISRSELEIRNLEIADFLDLAAARGNTPRGRGLLNATCRLNAAGVDAVELEGDASLRDLQLAGGFLGQDRPSLSQLQFTFKGSRRGDAWRLANLEIKGAPLRFAASGNLDRQAVRLTARGSLDLPELAAQLPHLLALHRQTVFKQGQIDFSALAEGAPADLRLQADCRTERLEVVHDGQNLAWDAPLALSAELEYAQGATRVRELRAHAPFFDASGSGGGDDFTLQATADLDRMFAQLDKLFALKVRAKGQAHLAASSKRVDHGDYRLETRLNVHDFALSRSQAVLLPAHAFALNAEAVVLPAIFQDGVLRSLRALRIAESGWLGKVELQGVDLQAGADASGREGGLDAPANCSLKGTVDLARLSAFFRAAAASPPLYDLKGRLSFDGSGQWRGAGVTLDALTGVVEQMVVAGPNGSLGTAARAALALDGRNALTGGGLTVGELKVAENWRDLQALEKAFFSVDLARRRLALRHLRCTTADAVVDLGFSLDDWSRPQADRSVEVRSDSTAALLAGLCKARGWLANEAELKGRTRAAFTSRISGQRSASELAVAIEPFELRLASKKVFVDPRLELRLSLASDRSGNGEVKIPALSLRTQLLRLEGTGLVRDAGEAPFVELQGSVTPDYAALVPLLEPLVGRETAATGTEAGTVLLSAPLRVPMDVAQVTLAAQLPLDSLRIRGLALRRLPLSVELNRGRVRAQIKASLGNGTLVLQPQWHGDGQQTTLTLPPASQVLLDAPLQPAMVAGFLGPLHPLFGLLAVPQGTVDLRVETLTLPMNGKGAGRPTLKAVLGVDKMRLRPVGVLQTVLETAGLAQGELRFKEREIACEAAKGRVSCAPVRLLAGDQEIVVRGTAGASGTLDYRVELPLTETLAQQGQLAVLGAAKVVAEIGGTRSAPLFDQPAFLASLAARAAAAASATAAEQSGAAESGQGESVPENEPKIPVTEE